MFCAPLDIPDEIIAAQEAGELVVFVGAGVSCGGTSGLPRFEGLTDQIGETIGRSRGDREDFDSILGEWHEVNGAKVHQIAQRIIDNPASKPASKPNEAHSLLLKLFRRPEEIRIVTTNYDRHFSTAAKELEFELPHYRAPALPLGDDFHGIVYLHGSVDDKPERLILTDADFGRAYLSQGWARTFLQALYARFHVLFVGYSHADTLLTYLARGLPSKDSQRRYAIQEVGDHRKWRQLGIHVVPYALSDDASDPHDNLTLGLRRWVQLSNYRPQDVRERIRTIVDGFEATQLVVGETGATTSNELSRSAEDFLRKALTEKSSVCWFVERAKDFRWIGIVHKLGVLPNLSWDIDTQNDRNLRDINSVLIWWATTGLISRTNADVLEIFALLGGKFGPQASRELLATLLNEDILSSLAWKSPFLDHWLTALRHRAREQIDDDLASALIGKLAVHGYGEHAVGLFGELLRVRMELTRRLSFDEEQSPLRASPKLTCDLYNLQQAWDTVQSLRTPAVDDRLWRMLVTCIEELYAVHGPILDGFDPIAGIGIVFDAPKETDRVRDATSLVGEMLLSVLRSKGSIPTRH